MTMIESNGVQVFEPAAESVVQALTRAEIDQQIATAKTYPRSLASFQRRCEEMVTLNPEIADECVYALPRDGKTIEGPSSRLAEIVASAWGNCRAAARVVSEDAEFVTAQGVFHDLETNVAISFEVKRRITDKHGKRYKADMIGVTGNAASSIALRNAIFKGVPKAYWSPAYNKAKSIAEGSPETLERRRGVALEHLAKQGVTEAKVLATLEVAGVQDIGINELARLRGILTAVKEGDTTLREAFDLAPPKSTDQGSGKGVRGVANALANEAGTPTDVGSLGSPVGGTDAAPASQRAGVIERAQMRKDVTAAVEASDDAVAFLSALSGRPVASVADLDDDTLRAVAAAIKGD